MGKRNFAKEVIPFPANLRKAALSFQWPGKFKSKTTTKYPYTPARVTNPKKTDTTNCCQGCGSTETLILVWMQTDTTTLESLVTSNKIKFTYTLEPSNSLLDIYPTEMNIYIYIYTKHMQENDHCCIIFNSQKLETTQISFNSRRYMYVSGYIHATKYRGKKRVSDNYMPQ